MPMHFAHVSSKDLIERLVLRVSNSLEVKPVLSPETYATFVQMPTRNINSHSWELHSIMCVMPI
eukprot:9021226-Heterocapsa_arctica.AAC.1